MDLILILVWSFCYYFSTVNIQLRTIADLKSSKSCVALNVTVHHDYFVFCLSTKALENLQVSGERINEFLYKLFYFMPWLVSISLLLSLRGSIKKISMHIVEICDQYPVEVFM